MKKIFTIISICLICYFGILQYYRSEKKSINKDDSKDLNSSELGGTGFIERTFSKIILDFLKTPEGQNLFTKMVKPVDPDSPNPDQFIFRMNNTDLINKIFNITSSEQKNSRSAVCGHVVDIEYRLQNLSNGAFETKKEIVELGSPELGVGLSTIIVGMYEGQTRTAKIPGRYLNNQDESITQSVEIILNKILSKDFTDGPSKIKIFDDILTYYIPYLCGEEINFEVSISEMDGTKIFQSKPGEKINYRIGDNKFPMIFSYSLFNKMKVGTRTIISPGTYFRSFDGSTPSALKLKTLDSEYYMIDIYSK